MRPENAYNGKVQSKVSRPDPFRLVFQSELRQPVYLTPDDLEGGWRTLFPGLARTLPRPYPIFARDEESILTHGYPVQLTNSMRQVRREIERLVLVEVEYRFTMAQQGSADKQKVMTQRERYLRSMSALLENALINDYDRGLVEILLLFHSGDVARCTGRVPALLARQGSAAARQHGDRFRWEIAGVFGTGIRRSAQIAADRLRRLAYATAPGALPPLITVLCHDLLLLAEDRVPTDLMQVREFIRLRFRADAGQLCELRDRVSWKLSEISNEQPELFGILRRSAGEGIDIRRPGAVLEPRLLDALHASQLTASLGLGPEQIQLLRELGIRMKCFELLLALRRVTYAVEADGPSMVLSSRTPPMPIAPSARPFDFTRPGVIDSSVRRFGLVYDLSNFTAILESLRKKGPKAEERALQSMYFFQMRLDEIRSRRRLTFEKFLGDGAFYSSRRAHRVIAAACEIHLLYDELRKDGFPFDQGMRIAVNFGTYRLLPMLAQAAGELRFEFFGHGIVELARLTTGKSTREVEEIAEFLIHSGYDPQEVDAFLQPLMVARGGQQQEAARPYEATIDGRGELVNEGIVVTLAFLQQLECQTLAAPLHQLDAVGLRWVLMPLDTDRADTLYVGLRLMGVARLKGLAPLELVEAAVWRELPGEAEAMEVQGSLITQLRRMVQRDSSAPELEEVDSSIPEELVVATFVEDGTKRRWVLGEYRDGDDVLLHALQVAIEEPQLADDEPLEMWLFRNRFDIARRYQDKRRSSTGHSLPLHSIRRRKGYMGCYLAAPHRAPQ